MVAMQTHAKMATQEGNIKTVNGQIVCPVHLLDNSMKTLLIDPTASVQDVCLQMAEKLSFIDPVDDSLCFSLHECRDGVTIERALKRDREVVPILQSWGDEYPDAKLVYQVKLFTESIIQSEDPKIIYMLFIQAVYNIITGVYPCNETDAIQLAALQFQAKFGPHNPSTHRPGFLTNTIVEYVPGPHLAQDKYTVEEWERMIFQKHSILMTEKPMSSYLAVVCKRDYYGAVLFAVKQKFDRTLPKKLFLGISRRGIMLLRIPKSFTDSSSMETLSLFELSSVYRWAYKPNVNFYFEVKDEDDENNCIYTFETSEGQHMSDLLTDYALALLREMGLNADGTPREKKRPARLSDRDAQEEEQEYEQEIERDANVMGDAAQRSGENAFEPEQEVEEHQALTENSAFEDEFGNPLPQNWTREYDEGSGNYYYFNSVTGDSQWESPAA